MPLLWKNTSCSEVFLALVDESVKDVENRLLVAAVNLKSEDGKQNAFHIPTELNDCLMKHCLCIAVSRNTSESTGAGVCTCVQMKEHHFETWSVSNTALQIAFIILRLYCDR
eukprot:Lankesteria_metandrocarpae@DN4506_c0_g1_i1.p1